MSNISIRTNKLMDQHLSKLGYDFMNIHVELPEELEKIVNLDFMTDNDCILLKDLNGINLTPYFDSDERKCEWEYNETLFHPDEYRRTEEEGEFLILALECARRLINRLKKEFKEMNFKVIVSFDETIIKNGEIETYGSSTLRFLKVRKNCSDDFMGLDDLEKNEIDAMMLIELTG